MASILRSKNYILIGHIQKLRKSGLSKRQIRDDEVVNGLLESIFDRAWELCKNAEENQKMLEKSDI